MIEKAREEIPISDDNTMDIQYADMCATDDTALVWFVSGNEYQAHYYLPMEVKIKSEAEYSYIRTYKPMSDLTDTAVLNWNRGYAFVFYFTSVPSEYRLQSLVMALGASLGI